MPWWYRNGMSDGDEDIVAVNLRLPGTTAKRLDEYVAARNAAGKGAKISRNAAIAVLLDEALEQQEVVIAAEPTRPKKVARR